MKKLLLSTIFFIFFCKLFSQVNATVGFGLFLKQPPNYFGLNCANIWTYQNGLREVNITSNLAEMGITNGRFIGGTFVMFFNWQTGKLSTKKELSLGYSTPNFNTYNPEPANKITDFKEVVGGQVASMVFNVNILTSNYNQQRAGILYTKLIGQKVAGIEMGNECYQNGIKDKQEFAFSFPTAESYADTVNSWIDSLRNTFGNGKKMPIAVSGTDQSVWSSYL